MGKQSKVAATHDVSGVQGLLWQRGKGAEARVVTARLDPQLLRLGPQQRPSLGSVVQRDATVTTPLTGSPDLLVRSPDIGSSRVVGPCVTSGAEVDWA